VGQSAPLVATAWGLLYFKEFKGCPRSSMAYLAVTVLFYVAAIVVLAFSSN
jgi:hypothetical protein